jgi:hypothetical protein
MSEFIFVGQVFTLMCLPQATFQQIIVNLIFKDVNTVGKLR